MALPWILKLLAKKVVFSISTGKNQIPPLLGKSLTAPPPGKIPSDAHGFDPIVGRLALLTGPRNTHCYGPCVLQV